MESSNKLLSYPLHYKRRKTITVNVGNLLIGSSHPIVIQSMLTSHTHQPEFCLKEIKQLKNLGCQLIRLAIPAKRDLKMMPELRRLMKEEGITIPLVADIHFAPHLALNACDFFEKIRINPGNFSDRSKNFGVCANKTFDLEEGKERFKERIIPLAAKLKKNKLALRIGVNQGSLSTRMLQNYGDTPLGMVKSALEAIQLFHEQNFTNIVVSLKSSNPLVVQKAYRLLCQLLPKNIQLPLHLGVTEAGNETAGRIKSLVGIAPLLFDGLGDTIRISLTEDSKNEILFAKKFLTFLKNYKEQDISKENYQVNLEKYRIENKALKINKNTSLANSSSVKIGKTENIKLPEYDFFETDFKYRIEKDNQFFFEKNTKPAFIWKNDNYNLIDLKKFSTIIFNFDNPRFIRKIYVLHKKFPLPVGMLLPAKIIDTDFSLEIKLACLLGEGLLDFLLLHPKSTTLQLKRISYILQATKTKISRTEYIACPSCGRTVFDLQDITAKIKAKTNHLKGVKIGIMGCMVNGPGEMADADFGYVGSATKKIDLYLGHKKIYKRIPESEAVDALITLIKKHNKWIEPNIKK